MSYRLFVLSLVALLVLAGCGRQDSAEDSAAESATPAEKQTGGEEAVTPDAASERLDYVKRRLEIYTPVALTADLAGLSDNQRAMLVKLMEAAKIMDRQFWSQAWGPRKQLLQKRIDDQPTRRFANINYGPWDRLNDNRPFVERVDPKPPGANFYPADMTKEEFENAKLDGKASQYTMIRRDNNGELVAIPYHEYFDAPLKRAAGLLKEAAGLAEHEGFADYLELRAEALLSGEYRESDMAWMEMKDNPIDLVYGPIETYEDQLFGYKAAFEAFVLIKDMEWSRRLARFAKFLPELQEGLPVPDEYKQEKPGTDSELNAYDAIYYAGDANAGAKTIAINLPNDEQVQLKKGTRRLQLKNAMRAKFDKILEPIAEELIAPDQRQHVTFDAFFQNTMFHEVAHGLGIKNTIDGESTVREALKEHASAMEEGKADILGLYMVQQLRARDEIPEGELMDNYVSFMASVFRSVRFGASSAHSKANMARFNFFRDQGAFTRDPESGTFRVNREAFEEAMTALTRRILTLQGDGDHAGAGAFLDQYGQVGDQLRGDLNRLTEAGVPVDIIFRQGVDVLGLQAGAASPDA
jgi:hypothetical protein